MLDAFEARLTDLLADALEGTDAISAVLRARDGMSPPGANGVRVVVQVVGVAPDTRVGDDRREILGQPGDWSLRPVLHLTGTVQVSLATGQARTSVDQQAQRSRVLGALDAVLVAMQAEAMRTGTGFDTGTDQGFDVRDLRLQEVEQATETSTSHRSLTMRFAFQGRFWPVEAPVAGDSIQMIPTRVAFLPVRLPEQTRVRAGDPELSIPVQVDLRSLNGAPARVVARLAGSEPPGQLVGITDDLPVGSVGYEAVEPGLFLVRYQPPAALSGSTRVRILLRLSHTDRVSVELAELSVAVVGT